MKFLCLDTFCFIKVCSFLVEGCHEGRSFPAIASGSCATARRARCGKINSLLSAIRRKARYAVAFTCVLIPNSCRMSSENSLTML